MNKYIIISFILPIFAFASFVSIYMAYNTFTDWINHMSMGAINYELAKEQLLYTGLFIIAALLAFFEGFILIISELNE